MSTSSAAAGRPRSATVDAAIADAVVAILERDGYGGVSIERVAADAGVAKTTVYRRWRGKEELVFATVFHGYDLSIPDTGSLHGDLAAVVTRLTATLARAATRNALFGLFNELAGDSGFRETFANGFLVAEHACLDAIVGAALARGELKRRVPAAVAHSLVVGPAILLCGMYAEEPSPQTVAALTNTAHSALTGWTG